MYVYCVFVHTHTRVSTLKYREIHTHLHKKIKKAKEIPLDIVYATIKTDIDGYNARTRNIYE